VPALAILAVIGRLATAQAAEPSYCDERPTPGASASIGAPAHGSLVGGVALREGPALRILSPRLRARCVRFGVQRLIDALTSAAERVVSRHPGSPSLGVGDVSRARGGPILAFSHSHQAGRDVDIGFYETDVSGTPVPTEDLIRFLPSGRARDGSELQFDVARNWSLVEALLMDRSIEVRWLFISEGLKNLLLKHARRIEADPALVDRAAQILHQPSDAPPHDDHLHMRIACTAEERTLGCR
jgi:murein endopeptidase